MTSLQLFPGRRLTLVAAVFAAMLLSIGMATAGGIKKSDDKVKAAIKSAKLDEAGNPVVVLELEVEKGWYIYANPVGNELLGPNATTVTVTGGAKALKVKFPEPILKKDDVVGDYKIYKGTVQIQATVQRTANDEVEFQIGVNACHEERGVCLQQGILKVTAK
jgi:DsbC/DsbD-like thiol-disulfide interchange protein